VRVLLAALVALLLAAAPASAATLTLSAGTLEFNAENGRRNVVTFEDAGAGMVHVARQLGAGGDEDAFTTATGCTADTAQVGYTCAGVQRVVANAGDGDDRLDASAVAAVPVTLRGGPGNDALTVGDQAGVLEGGDGDDTLTGGAGDSVLRGGSGNDVLYGGAGNELLDGAEGNDTLQGNGGRDDLLGGDGVDTAYFSELFGEPVTVTLDGAANDGKPGEADFVEADVENVNAGSQVPGGGPGAVSITGNAGPNQLEATQGAATITGGGGTDVLIGGPYDDVIDARDGVLDHVTCHAGIDTVAADAIDDVAADCETVNREAAPAPPPTPQPPVTPAPRRPAVRAFTPRFITRAALQAGSELGLFEEINRVTGVRPRSKVTLRCLKACSRKVSVSKQADAKGRVRLTVKGGLHVRKATRIELRISRSGERTRWVRYRFVRRVDHKRGLILEARKSSSGIAAR
jgi:hypothetical protein